MKNSLITIILFILLVMMFYFLLKKYGFITRIEDVQQLNGWLVNAGSTGPFIIIGIMALAIIINPIPSAPIAVATGAVFGHTFGTIYVITGAAIGAQTAFWIARSLGHETLNKLFSKQVGLSWLGSQNSIMVMVFISRLIPFVSFDLVSYGAGLTAIASWRFALATVTGLIPASFLLTHFGSELNAANLNHVLSVILFFSVIMVFPFVIKGFKKWYQQRHT